MLLGHVLFISHPLHSNGQEFAISKAKALWIGIDPQLQIRRHLKAYKSLLAKETDHKQAVGMICFLG